MKISKYLAFAFAGLLMVSCDEDFDDWASPKSYPQEEAITIPGYSATAAEGAVIDMAQAPASVKIVDLAGEALPEGFTLQNIRLLATPEGVEGAKETEINLADDGTVETSVLDALTIETFGRRPVQRVFNCKVLVDAVKDGQAVLIDAGTVKFKLTPVAPDISKHYYLIGGIAGTEWNPTCTTLPFNHSDKDIYDDPVFTITFPVAEGENWFAFVDDVTVEKNDWSYVYACAEGNGKNGDTGKICRRKDLTTGDDGSFKIVVNGDAKFVKMTIDLFDGTYKFEKLNFGEYFYEIGGESGWKTPHALYGPNNDGKYLGYYWLEGEFKFKPNKDDWNGDYEYAGDNKIADIGGANCPDPGAGFYKIDVDLQEGTYNLTKVESITCVGVHNGWNQADAALHMTYNSAEGCWELTTNLTNGFKFAMNDDWKVSWGGANDDPAAYDNITQNGGKDLNVPDGDGVYSIKLYLSHEGANRVVLVKQP